MNGLYSVQALKGVKFALIVSKNMRLIKSELADIDEVSKPTPEFMELSQKVQMLEQAKDTEGIKKLEEENNELVDARKKQLDEVNELLDEESELYLFKIGENKLPSDITAQQIQGIELIIKE